MDEEKSEDLEAGVGVGAEDVKESWPKLSNTDAAEVVEEVELEV